MTKEYNEHMFVCLPPPPPTSLPPQEEFLSFAVVIHGWHWIDQRRAYVTTFNILPLPSNENSF